MEGNSLAAESHRERVYTGLSITPVYPWVEQRRRNNERGSGVAREGGSSESGGTRT